MPKKIENSNQNTQLDTSELNKTESQQPSSNFFVAPAIESGDFDNKKAEAIQCGLRIRRFRTSLTLTLDELSELTKMADPEGAGVSKVAISRYENADSLPGYREIKLLSHAMGVSITRFFYDDEDPFGAVRPTIEEIVKEMVKQEMMGGLSQTLADISFPAINRRAFDSRIAEIRRKREEKR
ncbi:helix-turn-helix domain-containing protein [Undibacterium sp. Xuan67W]|uniref:helix-turn-helix domain-containing protein n=1 Tax=Undibacterium sp. Xuan67W TaxID=3413057 RepID=UPI003BF050C0